MSELDDLTQVRAYVLELARPLDAGSRYLPELLALVDSAQSVAELERRLGAGCRGQRHAGPEVFARMRLEEKLLANLITPETTLFRFSEGELEAIDLELLPRLGASPARALIVPCSHGEEAFTLAAYLLKMRLRFSIDAYDIQAALIEEARTGRLTFGYPLEHLASAGYVAGSVLSLIRFQVGDAFALPEAEPYHLVLCRNFAGYFTLERAQRLVERLVRQLAPGGALFLDGFVLGKHPELCAGLEALGGRRSGLRPVYFFPRGPEDSSTR